VVNTGHFSRRETTPLGLGVPRGSLSIATEYCQKVIDILSERRIGGVHSSS
jgi:hypothetical protein